METVFSIGVFACLVAAVYFATRGKRKPTNKGGGSKGGDWPQDQM